MTVADTDSAVFDARIEALTHALEASADAGARASARELVRLVLDLHRAGLRRLVDVLTDAPVPVRQRAAGDPIVAALMALHELEPPDTRAGGTGDGAAAGSALLQIARVPAAASAAAIDVHPALPSVCERCGTPVGEAHHHQVDTVSRRLSCSCRACWLLSGSDAAHRSVRAVPDRYAAGPALALTDAQWDALQLPVSIVFFLFNSTIGRTIAFYPSPAGATESALPLDAWRGVVHSNPWIGTAAADVEAILVRRGPGGRCQAFLVPIDACYDLVGRVRRRWSGFDGGDAVRAEIDHFFERVAARSAESPVG